MLVCSARTRVSDENAAGSQPTYPSEPVPNPVLLLAYQIEPPSTITHGNRRASLEMDNQVQARRVAAAYQLCTHRKVNGYEEEYTYSTHIDYSRISTRSQKSSLERTLALLLCREVG